LAGKVRVMALRQISSYFFVSAMQLRELLGLFENDPLRADCMVLFFFRVVDMQNQKVFKGRFEHEEEWSRLRRQLGYMTCFPFIQPENSTFELNFAFHDQRLAATTIILLSQKERETNIKDVLFFPEGSQTPKSEFLLPRTWASLDSIPRAGYLTLKYVCAPEDRVFTERKRFYEGYGLWKLSVTKDEVKWWSALTEAPEPVLELLEYLTGNFVNLKAAFNFIDGDEDGQGNAELTLRELESGIKRMGCHKFQGDDANEDIKQIFRYLDPNGEGTVSLKEWLVMEQLWAEMMLSLREFVNFLARFFDCHPDSLERAWELLDADGSGGITFEEWHDAVTRQLQYFGPSKIIFKYLDKDDEGTVSLDEFLYLRTFFEEFNRKTQKTVRARRGALRVNPF